MTNEASTNLRAWLDGAWDAHAKAPRRVADELLARAAGLGDDADSAEAVRLGEHVLLAHLDDAAGLATLLAGLPPAPALAASAQRARWALATLAGEPAPELPDAARWRALHSVVMACVHRGHVAEARQRLFAEEAAAASHASIDARKAYAATAHNTALDLRQGARGDAARDALMIEAAHLERRAWAAAEGSWMNAERADYQLAMCHAVLGRGAEAVRFASACLDACEAHGADAAERFFAHECCVHAWRAAGDGAAATAHRERMVALLEQISEPGMRSWCSQTLAGT